MLTPWGDLPVADAHVHFFSHQFFTLLARQKQVDVEAVFGILGWQRPAENPVAFADAWLAEFDRHGVHRAMLIASLPGDVASVTAAVSSFPERFWGAAMVNPLLPVELPPEIRTVCLFPALHGYSLKDVEILPRKNYFVHCGNLSIGVRAKLGLPNSFPPQNPLELQDLALAHPDTRFVIPHFGSGLWREALFVAKQCPNVYLDTSSSNSWSTVPLATVFAETLDTIGPRRLLFGTDSSFFPRGWNVALANTQFEALQTIRATPTLARRILAENLYDFCEM